MRVSIWMGFPDGSAVKNLPATAGKGVQSLGQKDPLEKEMATHCSILAWETCGQRSLAGYSPWGHRVGRYDWVTKQQQQQHLDTNQWVLLWDIRQDSLEHSASWGSVGNLNYILTSQLCSWGTWNYLESLPAWQFYTISSDYFWWLEVPQRWPWGQ